MNWYILLPLILGAFGILQGTINRQISSQIGIAQATLISNFGTLILCSVFYLLVKYSAQSFPELFKIRAPLTTYNWWFIFPAIFGFLIVTCMPFAFAKLGAVKVTVGLIAAQMITSALWDIYVENIAINALKIMGMIFSFLSVVLIMLSK